MQFQKQDLEQTHYSWGAEDQKQLFSGHPSRRSFDRFNGDQVLFMINAFAEESEDFSIQRGRQIEHQIMHYLPLDSKSEVSVFNWLRDWSTANTISLNQSI